MEKGEIRRDSRREGLMPLQAHDEAALQSIPGQYVRFGDVLAVWYNKDVMNSRARA